MLAAMRREQEVSRMKTDFVSSVSHEMRTPLTTLRMIGEMFQTGKVKEGSMAQEYYSILVGETDRLTRLINKVLDFSRMESGRKPYSLVVQDIGPEITSSVKVFETSAENTGYHVELDIHPALPKVNIDSDAMSQVLLNLLDNAMKYSPDHKTIQVRVFPEGPDVIIEVTDHGIGIEADKLDKIFKKFYRGEDELTRQTKGTGIGLAIVKHIVQAHGGTIQVKSRRGKGSVFSVALPKYADSWAL